MADGAQTLVETGLSTGQAYVGEALYADRQGLIAEICERLAKGENLTAICRDANLPSHESVYAWAREDEKIAERIARARAIGYDAIALRARRTARGDQVEGDSTGDVQRDKLICELDLKLLAKWDPKRYGDSMQLKHADADGKKLDTAPLIAELLGALGASPAVDLAQLTNVTPNSVNDDK